MSKHWITFINTWMSKHWITINRQIFGSKKKPKGSKQNIENRLRSQMRIKGILKYFICLQSSPFSKDIIEWFRMVIFFICLEIQWRKATSTKTKPKTQKYTIQVMFRILKYLYILNIYHRTKNKNTFIKT
jgi:hypothetical protein